MINKLRMVLRIIFLITTFLFTSITIVQAAPDPPINGVPVNGIFSIPYSSNSYIDSNGKVVIITKAQIDQVGSIFSTKNNLLNLNQNFSASMFIYLGDRSVYAGDGMTFVLHNDVGSTQRFLKGVGEQLGVYAKPKSGSYVMTQQLEKSFAIEFDTYYNKEANNVDGMDAQVNANDKRGHVAYAFPSSQSSYYFNTNLTSLYHKAIYYPSEHLSNGKWKPFEVSWNATTKILSYKFDVAPIVNVPINANEIFGTTDVYWGFTGSTGGAFAETAVIFNKVPGLVNLEEKFKLVNNKGETAAGKEVAEKENLTSTFDINYLSGKQNLLTPNLELVLGDTINYKKGTLKYNGTKIDDSNWNGKSYIVPMSDLSLTNSNASVSFDVETENVGRHELKNTGVSATIKAGNYSGNKNESTFSVKGKGNTLTLSSEHTSLNLMPSDIEDFNVLKLTNSQILQNFIGKLNIVANDPEMNTTDGITIQAVDETVYDHIKKLQNGSINLDLIAKKADNASPVLRIQLIFQNGALSFSSVPETIDFNEGDPTVSLGVIQAKPNKSLVINDTRVSGSPWKLQATTTNFKTKNEQVLNAELSYVNSEGENLVISSTIQMIQKGSKPVGSSVVDISKTWSKNKGLLLKIGNDNYLGAYGGTINWTLTDVP